ncbi:DUF1573 domain-containing protein [Spirosoma fluviale]|uniref:Uncharacterized protein n=1 Tax=Spirosoma fluviale TaxID=1597977 RepID=A0A286FCT3_9BACT|nr:DUF1573 domain-containing protein [Spirosoma fluviale]SOD81010.1 Protein of unknown function [Spirosoma fluviale]
MEFSPTTYPLGDVAVTETAEAVFKRAEGGKAISRVDSSCGCAVIDGRVKPDQTDIKITFSAGYLPEGVKASGKTEYLANKYVTVVYADDTFDTLFITARVYEPQPAQPAEVVPDSEA